MSEMSVPKHITAPIGAHNELPLRIMGTTPMDAAKVVSNIGRIRRLVACRMASELLRCSLCLSSSAKSKSMIPSRTNIPMSDTIPRILVILKLTFTIIVPSAPPRMVSERQIIMSSDMRMLLKCQSRMKNMITTDASSEM